MTINKSKIKLLLPLILIPLILTGCNSTKYQDAVDKMDQGDYQAALEIFDDMPNYEDSSDKASECRYQLGIEAIASEDWELAIEYLSNLDYEDSADLLEKATREKGMSENADNEFLSALETSILDRIDSVSNENYDNKTIINTELVYVEEYKDATFFDENLKELAIKYIDGLNMQKEALGNENFSEVQIEWQRGIVARYEVLRDLYEQYDFLSDNTDFVAIYVSACEDQENLLRAYEALDNDIAEQMNSDSFQWYIAGNQIYWTLNNNTNYTYSTTFNITLYDANDVVLDEATDYIENIPAGSSYTVSFYVSDPGKISSFDWNNYYDAIYE